MAPPSSTTSSRWARDHPGQLFSGGLSNPGGNAALPGARETADRQDTKRGYSVADLYAFQAGETLYREMVGDFGTEDSAARHLFEALTLLSRGRYRGGFDRQDVLELLRFIDWMLRLPPELEARLNREIEQFEAETKMRYVTTWERKGIVQGEATVLRRLLRRRFTPLPDWVDERLDKAKREELESWADRVIDAKALEDVFVGDQH